MNKKVYLCDLEWTDLMKGHRNNGTPDFLGNGGLKATIVFNDAITYDELKKIDKINYFNITDEDYKSRNEKAIEKLESIRIFGLRSGKTLFSTLINETIDILQGSDKE